MPGQFIAIQVDGTLELLISLSDLYIIGSHAGYYGIAVHEDGYFPPTCHWIFGSGLCRQCLAGRLRGRTESRK